MRKITILLIGLLISPFCIKAQQEMDSTNSTKLNQIDSTDVYYFLASIDSLALGKLHFIDTSIKRFHNYEENFNENRFLAHLGNPGLAAKNMIFEPEIHEGFEYFNSPFIQHNYLNNKIKYYQLFKPYTELNYASGPNKEQSLTVIHTQNIYPGLNIGVNFHFLNAPGLYKRQESNNSNLYLTARYTTKNKRYGIIANYLHDKIEVEENGGIKTDSIFENNLETNRQILDIKLNDGLNTLKKGGFYFNQYFNLRNPTAQSNDTIPKDSIKSGFKFGRFTHSFHYEQQRIYFSDNSASDSSYFQILGDPINKSNLFDSVSVSKIENEFKWSNLDMDDQPEDKPIYFYLGIKHQFTSVSDTLTKKTFNQIIPKGGFSVFALKSFRLTVDAYLVIGDYNLGDLSINANIQQYLGNKNKNLGMLILSAEYKLQSPLYYFQYYQGNTLQWDNDFGKESIIKTEAKYRYKGLQAGVNFYTIDNFTYFDETSKPLQYDNAFTMLSANLRYGLKYKNWQLDMNMYYQKVSNDDILRLPEFVSYFQICYTKSIFEKVAVLQPGLQIFYNTPYLADAYNPAIRAFYLQNEKEVGNAIYADIFLNLKIKRTLFFIKYQHFNASFTGYNYIMVPGYPLQDAALKFGLSWKFYD